jgi:hypothetical protein
MSAESTIPAENFRDVDRNGERSFFGLVLKDAFHDRMDARVIVPTTDIRQESQLVVQQRGFMALDDRTRPISQVSDQQFYSRISQHIGPCSFYFG